MSLRMVHMFKQLAGLAAPKSIIDERNTLTLRRDEAQRLARLAQAENSTALDRLYDMTLKDIRRGRRDR